jgi:hypothetical protein
MPNSGIQPNRGQLLYAKRLAADLTAARPG